jgi:16S rRNA (cytosine967-C5)-methyltransferase
MTPGARLQAAIDILTEWADRREPAATLVARWARSNRYAGSRDRQAIADIVFAAFRHRARAAWAMGDDSPRALALAAAARDGGHGADEIASWCDGAKYSAAPLNDAERAGITRALEEIPPEEVTLNLPGWVIERLRADPMLDVAAEAAAMQARAPIDLRVNTLKKTRARALEALRGEDLPVETTPWSPLGLRLPPETRLRLDALKPYQLGQIEPQDEGAQIAALMTGAAPKMQVAELGAGGGGKTLALAAMMENTGQICACDTHDRRLKAGMARARKADARNVQPLVISPWSPAAGGADPDLEAQAGRMDVVVLDVPCSGSGTWRREPDAPWRLDPGWLEKTRNVQADMLARGARLVKPGGRLAYITCTLLAEENADQIARFLESHAGFALMDAAATFTAVTGQVAPQAALRYGKDAAAAMIQLSPAVTGTDGFFIALLEREA